MPIGLVNRHIEASQCEQHSQRQVGGHEPQQFPLDSYVVYRHIVALTHEPARAHAFCIDLDGVYHVCSEAPS